MSVTVATIASAIARANDAMGGLEQVLNEADAKLGDGDTGGMLARVIGKMAETDLSSAAEPAAALSQLAKAASIATGSSLGTLFATGLLAVSRESRGRETIEAGELSPLIAKARDAMIARGGASLGDKTVLESLDAISRALEGVDSTDEAASVAAGAAGAALDEFRGKPNRIGRARMFGDQTIGQDDPGMLAIKELSAALAR